MSLVVVDPGLASRIVDQGRPHTRSLGVPVGGAADRGAFVLGNALLGNSSNCAALECTLIGPRLRTEVDVGAVIVGAPFEAWCDGAPIDIGHTFTLHAGAELHIGGTRRGMRAYLCLRGGLQTPLILGSRSGLEVLRAGDRLSCAPSKIHARYCPELHTTRLQGASFGTSAQGPWQVDGCTIAVLPGLQASWFDMQEFTQRCFTVSSASDRMGLRLGAEPLTTPQREMISEPVCPGAVQVTRAGQCIILGVDGQTIGGYPKIAQVIQADLDLLGQLRPGQPIFFEMISYGEALQRYRQVQAQQRDWVVRLHLSLDAFPAERKFASL